MPNISKLALTVIGRNLGVISASALEMSPLYSIVVKKAK